MVQLRDGTRLVLSIGRLPRDRFESLNEQTRHALHTLSRYFSFRHVSFNCHFFAIVKYPLNYLQLTLPPSPRRRHRYKLYRVF